MSFSIKNKKHILLLTFFISCIGGLIFYIQHNFVYQSQLVESVEIFSNSPKLEKVYAYMHIKDNQDLKFDYNKLYRPKKTKAKTFLFQMEENVKMRNSRLYFKDKLEYVLIDKIVVHSKDFSEVLDLKTLNLSKGITNVNNDNGLGFSVETTNSFLEIKKTFIYKQDISALVVAFLLIVLILIILIFVFNRMKFDFGLDTITLPDLSVFIFLGAIFMPHPVFNVALIISFLLVVKRFNVSHFYSNKLNLFFIAYFSVLFLNDLFVAPSGYHNLKATETYLPFLVLPIYISCLKGSKYIRFFPLFAILIGCGFFLTSIVNFAIFKNFDCFSFNEFTKFTHPVYYSYLVAFSIFSIFFYSKIKTLYKSILQALLFCFLILAGSKLVIIITLIIYVGLSIKNKRAVLIVIGGLIALSFFPPVQKRFKEILNMNDLSVVKERVISDSKDPRVNGLTLRLLLWQESIRSLNTIPEYFLGLGVDNSTNDILKANLTERGLGNYKQYSTHNQFVNVFMRAGILGFISLLMIIVYAFYFAVIKKKKMLLIMVIMFTFAMLTESVFQRVLGIYFFTTILLFLMKPNYLHEDSNNWD